MSPLASVPRATVGRWPPGEPESAARVGDEVVAQDGSLGRVDRVIRFETNDPAYLVVEVRRGLGKRYPIVPCALVTRIDRIARCVHLRGRCRTLRRLPETIPIVV
jgi:hypothetical protein